MNKNHYVIYFDENTNQAVTKTSREWARENQDYFPNHDFINNTPTSNEINYRLVSEYGYTLISDDEKFVCFKLTN